MTDSPPDIRPASATSRALRSTIEWVVIIAGALIVALAVRTFVVQPFYIPSASMQPQLMVGDRVLVNKMSYHLHDINRGDVVVFERPKCESGEPAIKDLIKRVIGLPGERVEARGGSIYIDGRRLAEPYLPTTAITSDFGPVEVPAHHIWVMGDNRQNSKDSRFLCNNGPTFIDEGGVVGRAFVRVWPPADMGGL
ncbi:MAG TPA: signal peptidase I [Acidimicrobiales bacterium]|nr:signal peptidase I [Acidimicrobiales bacterium]